MLLAPIALAALLATAPPRSVPDITFATIGKEKLQLDLILPRGPGPHPIVVCFHGGAWAAGDRKDLLAPTLFHPGGQDGAKSLSLLQNLAKQGYAAATVSYRLAPKSKFPAQIEDAKTAVRFLRANAAKYDLDPDRIAAIGFSAGAHLSLLLGLTDSEAGFDGALYPEQKSSVNCVVDFFGPTDMRLYAESPGLLEGFVVPFLGKAALTDDAVLKKASPLEYVSKGDAPILIIHGTMDLVVPIVHSEKLLKKCKECDVPCEMVKIRWKGHGWEDPTAVKTSADATLDFLAKQLKPAVKK